MKLNVQVAWMICANFLKEEEYDIADYYLIEIKSARSSGFI
jgi:hypothetical protein